MAEDLTKVIDIFKKTNLQIKIINENTSLGTGGAILNCRNCIEAHNILVCNGDSLFPIDLQNFLKIHLTKKSDATVALGYRENRKDVGFVITDEKSRILSFNEKQNNVPGNKDILINGGLYVFKNVDYVFDYFKEVCSLEEDVFPFLLERNVFGVKHDLTPLDIGTPKRFGEIDKLLRGEILNTMP